MEKPQSTKGLANECNWISRRRALCAARIPHPHFSLSLSHTQRAKKMLTSRHLNNITGCTARSPFSLAHVCLCTVFCYTPRWLGSACIRAKETLVVRRRQRRRQGSLIRWCLFWKIPQNWKLPTWYARGRERRRICLKKNKKKMRAAFHFGLLIIF